MINFLSMEYFLTVAETRSFSAAAKQLYISQQTLSAHIAQIEKEVGTRLFERTRPLTLTSAGERFLRGIREMLFINTQMERDLKDLVDPYQNSFQIGVSHAYARALLPALLDEFYQSFPQIHLKVYEMGYGEMNEALSAGKVDLILTRPSYQGANVRTVLLYESDDVYLYAPDTAVRRAYGEETEDILEELEKKAELSLVKKCPFILPRSGNVYENAAAMLMEAKISPERRIEVDTLETAISLCRRGLGITISPGMLLPAWEDKERGQPARQSYLISENRREYALAVCYRENTSVTQGMRAFIEIMKKR